MGRRYVQSCEQMLQNHAPGVDRLQHRLIVTPAFRTTGIDVDLRVCPMAIGPDSIALPDFLAQAGHVAQARGGSRRRLRPCSPSRRLDVDGWKADAAALRVLDQRGGM